MRVMFWSAAFWPSVGGVQHFGGRLVRSLRDRGHDVTVIAEQDAVDLPLEDDYDGVRVARLPLAWRSRQGVGPVADVRQRVGSLKRSFKPQLVHTNGVSDSDFFHHETAGVSPSPWLVTLHGTWADDRRLLVQRTLRSADWVSGCSQWIVERGRRLAPEIRERSSVIPNGSEEPSLAPAPLPFETPRLLYLGRLSPEKRVDLLLDALADLVAQHPSIEFVIAGDGPEREALVLQAARSGLENRVRFLGWIASVDVPALINSATVVLLASEQEAFGLAALEAAFMARPVVAPRRGGLSEIIEHERTGILVDRLAGGDLAKAVSRLLKHPELASGMGEAARARARTDFDWESCVDAYEALYEKLVTVHGNGLSEARHV